MSKYKILDDDGKLLQRYKDKKSNARNSLIEFDLSFYEYCSLVSKAGITGSQIGRQGYHLGRYGDKGGYNIHNCRFIHHKANLAERIVDFSKISKNLLKYYETHDSPFLGSRHSKEAKVKIGQANAGTHWITNGVKNARLKRGIPLPTGWGFGRTKK